MSWTALLVILAWEFLALWWQQILRKGISTELPASRMFSEIFYLRPSSSKNTYFRLSLRPSVCPSVTPYWQCSCHCIILKFSGLITIDRCDVHAKGRGQRSMVKVTEVMTPLSRFRNVTLVWIHTWWSNDAQSLMRLRRGALLFFKVILQISRSHCSKNGRIWPKLWVSGQ